MSIDAHPRSLKIGFESWCWRERGEEEERGKKKEGRRKKPRKKPLRRARELNPRTLEIFAHKPSVLSTRRRRHASNCVISSLSKFIWQSLRALMAVAVFVHLTLQFLPNSWTQTTCHFIHQIFDYKQEGLVYFSLYFRALISIHWKIDWNIRNLAFNSFCLSV